MAKNGQKWPKGPKKAQIVKLGPKRPKWSKSTKRPKMAKGRTYDKGAPNNKKCHKTQKDPKRPKVANKT